MKNFMMKCGLATAVLGLVAGAAATPASGVVILQNTAGTGAAATQFFGESFTTPAGEAYSNIAFNFYSDIPATTPTAAGTAFLLTQEYLGTPAGLSSALSGFLAQSIGISGGRFLFAPSLVLQPSTMYFLYGNTSFITTGGNSIAGGNAYFSLSSTSNFTTVPVSGSSSLQASNFLLTGDPVATAVPEPATLAGAATCILFGLGYVRRRRRVVS